MFSLFHKWNNVGFFHQRRVYIGDYTTSGQKSNQKKSPSARRARVIFWLLFATSGIICQYTRVSGERTALFNRKWRHKSPFNFTENLPAVVEWSFSTTCGGEWPFSTVHSPRFVSQKKIPWNFPWRMIILHGSFSTVGPLLPLYWGFFLTGGYSNDGAYDWIMVIIHHTWK